jgi:hypothetical protein
MESECGWWCWLWWWWWWWFARPSEDDEAAEGFLDVLESVEWWWMPGEFGGDGD